MTEPADENGRDTPPARGKAIPPAAKRALEEARLRRETARPAETAPERGGRDGPEPVRFGDWEVKGLATDF